MRDERSIAPREPHPERPLAGARLEPPRLDRGQMLRPRLLSVLAQRWDRRATLVIAGAGFGKSTLLGQALAENRLAPRGFDLWLSLTPSDGDGSRLLSALCTTLADTAVPSAASAAGSVDPSIGTMLSMLSDLPPGTCLVIDDLHHVPPSSSGHRVLERLVTELPLQCSLLIGSRTAPALPFAEWQSKGLIETITESMLAYDDAELIALAASMGRSGSELTGLGGWPALVELSLAVGRDGSESYLRQAVLDRLPARQQRWLGALHAIGGGDPGLVAAALGETETETETESTGTGGADFAALAALPAMQVLADGGLQPHALWHDALSQLTTPSDRVEQQRRAAAELLRRGDHDASIRLHHLCHDIEGMCAVVVDSCTSGTWRYPVQTLQRWRNLLPAEAADRPEARLLDAISGREGATFDAATVAAVSNAAAEFRQRGDTGAEVAALAELAFVAREQGNTEAFTSVALRLFELLAAGRHEVAGFVALVHATVAEAADDDQATLDALADLASLPLSRQWTSRAHWLRAHSAVMLGRPDAALVDAHASLTLAEDDFLGARYLLAYIDWWSGVTCTTMDGLPFIGDERYRTPFDCVYGGGVFAALHAFAGSIELAEQSLSIAVEAAGSAGEDGLFARPEYAGILRTSQAAIAAARGDDVAAAAALQHFFAEHAVTSPIGRRVARRLPALVHVLVPDVRVDLDAAPLGPAHDEVRAIGRWFAQLREGDPVPPPPCWGHRLLNALPLPWAVEAAARLVAVDVELAAALTDRLVDLRPSQVRSLLRDFATDPVEAAIRTGARHLLGVVPIRPDTPVRLTLFGAMTVRDGESSRSLDDPALADARRVIGALTVLGPSDSTRLAATIWPAATPHDAAARLRAAVTVARDMLEPRRRGGDAPFLLREVGGQLSIAPPPWLQSDVQAFQVAVSQASDAARLGAHSAELESLERALAEVSGPPLPDLAGHDLGAEAIESIVASVVRVGQRAAALRFGRGDHAAARRHASAVLAVDPSNESSHQIVVASYTDEGRTAAALDAFATWHRTRADLGLGASREMSMLARRLGLSHDLDAATVGSSGRLADGSATGTALTVDVLGRFAATMDGREVTVVGGKPQELVKLLAITGRPMPEDEACEALWPGVHPEVGRRRLRNVVARVRAAGPFVERGERLLALADVVSVDLRRFEMAARTALRAPDDIASADAALEAYAGELLPADRFLEWTMAPRERVRALVVELLERAVDRASTARLTSVAVEMIDRLLEVEPFADHWADRAAAMLIDDGQTSAAQRWSDRAELIRRGFEL